MSRSSSWGILHPNTHERSISKGKGLPHPDGPEIAPRRFSDFECQLFLRKVLVGALVARCQDLAVRCWGSPKHKKMGVKGYEWSKPQRLVPHAGRRVEYTQAPHDKTSVG